MVISNSGEWLFVKEELLPGSVLMSNIFHSIMTLFQIILSPKRQLLILFQVFSDVFDTNALI